MSDEWFAYRLAPDGDIEDGCHPEEAQAMKDYVHQKTTAIEAAHAITHPTRLSDNPADDLARLWGFLMDALIELPSDHVGRLIELMQAIENLPEPDFSAIDDMNQPGEKLWKGLSGFGHMWSDTYQSGNWRDIAKVAEGSERDSLRDKHVRMAEVEARLVTADIGGIPIDWGYEVVADALESDDALRDFEVPAAAQWFIICGQRFRQGAEDNDNSWALKPRNVKSGDATPSDGTMSLERWSTWEKRLKELQKEPGVVQDAATKALSAMSK
ncbi:hypothetical protein GQ44DRAFT_702992 [Phaeosphaeriaceae sp. PMI808]|nr:hypothetical protein GQ44DRAFT_702992 [Phaeosphaeriaceae sp. PMI808]